MPGVGGGGGGGGFHGGGFSGGGGGGGFHGGGGYYGGGYYGGYYRRGGLFSSIIGAILSPLIFGLVGIVLIVAFFLTLNSKSVKYDEDTMQEFALERYADLYGVSEDGILFVFLASKTPEEDGYYQISIVGYDYAKSVNYLFGNDTTVFGRAVDDGLPANYKNSLTTGLSYAVESTAGYIVANIGKDNVFSRAKQQDLTPRFVNQATYLNINATIVQESLDQFKQDTGAVLSIYVDDVDNVFKRGSNSWVFLIVGLICLGISVFLIFLAVKAVKAIKERRSGGGSSGSGSSSGGSPSGSARSGSDDPYGFTDRYSE